MKRHIFYCSYYKNGVRQGNCGYVRMIIHNGVCRMDIHIDKVMGLKRGVKGYFCCQQEEKIIGYPLFESSLQQGNLQIRCECNYADGVYKRAVYEMDGMLLFDGEDKTEYIVMNMKNVEIRMKDFVEYVEKSDNEADEIKELKIEEKLSTEKSIFPQENVEKTENSVYEYDEECLKKKQEQNKDQNDSCLETEEVVVSPDWKEKIFHAFPKVRVKINGEDTTAIKLRPHDIVWFPGIYWRLATNPFLLNGYYNYRYIIFFQGQDEKYYLGTPGCFGIHDAMNAKKFGFTDFFVEFESMENVNCPKLRKERCFGYWVREVEDN